MREDYPSWLIEQKYAEGTRNAQINRVRKVEDNYGSLDEHFANRTIDQIISSLEYTTNDERLNRPNPSKIKFEGDIRTNLQSYKSAVVRYMKFLTDKRPQSGTTLSDNPVETTSDVQFAEESLQQRFSLERDMQFALRQNITSLDPALKIIDDGAERSVDSGLIDITCEDNQSVVVVELKAGKADSRAIGQILGYMGDVCEEDGKSVRGILVAHDFDKRTKAAARVVPTLTLKKYSIEFKFTSEE
jgi:endonuclease